MIESNRPKTLVWVFFVLGPFLWCHFLAMPWAGLQSVVVAFLGNAHLHFGIAYESSVHTCINMKFQTLILQMCM